MEKGTLVTASKTGGPGSDPVPTGQWPKDDGVKDQARGTGWEQGGGGGDRGGEGRKTAHSPSGQWAWGRPPAPATLTRRRPGELSALVSIVPLSCSGSQPDPCPGEGD